MIGRFKNALISAVSNNPSGTDGASTNGNISNSSGPGEASNGGGSSSRPPFSSSSSSVPSSTRGSFRITGSSHASKSNSLGRKNSTTKPVKYEYSRPHFLNMNTLDEIQVTADHTGEVYITNSGMLEV